MQKSLVVEGQTDLYLDISTECDCQPLVLVPSCQGGHPAALHTLGPLIFVLETRGGHIRN